jgi:hypothetical protein
VPGKSTRTVYEHLLLDARRLLSAQGVVAVVVVAPLAPLLGEILEAAGVSVEVMHDERSAGHAVFHYRFAAQPDVGTSPRTGFERGIYERASGSFEHRGTRYSLQAMHGLPEFDTLSFHTGLALDVVQRLGSAALGRVTVWNPGQGHVPAYLARRAPGAQLRLVDPDLLALRASRLNATTNGIEPARVELHHTVLDAPDGPDADLVVDLLRPKEPAAALTGRVEAVVAGLRPGAVLVVAGRSTSVTRYLTALEEQRAPMVVTYRHRTQGCMVTELRKEPPPPG